MRNIKLTLAIICTAQILGMIPFAMYPTLIPTLQVEWGANNTEIGWVAGIYFGGYLLAVTILVPLTDRINSRWVYLYSMALTIIIPLLFGFFTSGIISASLWRFLQGVGLAGTYMPGLKAMVDAVPDRMQSRTVAMYTMCFGLGVAVSFLVAGVLAKILPWQWVFAASALGPVVAYILTYLFLPPTQPAKSEERFRLIPNFGPVFQNRKALGFSIAYSVHNAELFVFRSWAVTFLAFALTQREPGAFGGNWNPAFIVACATLVAQPFSVFTNELAERLNRVKVILVVMTLSAISGIALGFSSQMSMIVIVCLVCIYAILSISDSASITSAVVRNAESHVRGTTMAFHTLVGFVGAFVGPILFGVVLDLAGGGDRPAAWGIAFIGVAVLVLIGPIAIRQTGNTS